MQVSEKLKLIRHIKQWSQEEVAHRLNISPSTYGSMERGETKLSLERLKELAKVFEMDLAQLLDSDKINVFNLGGTHSNHSQNWYNNSELEQFIELKHEVEKLRLLLQERDKENEYLKQIIELLRNQKTS